MEKKEVFIRLKTRLEKPGLCIGKRSFYHLLTMKIQANYLTLWESGNSSEK